MKEFKFFSENKDEFEFLDDDSPSWLYESHHLFEISRPYVIVNSRHRGIRDFLSMFPPRSIQVVRAIRGWSQADGDIRVHNGNVDYDDGWGFDIVNDLINVEWLNFN
jgi:hypothetical protein